MSIFWEARYTWYENSNENLPCLMLASRKSKLRILLKDSCSKQQDLQVKRYDCSKTLGV